MRNLSRRRMLAATPAVAGAVLAQTPTAPRPNPKEVMARHNWGEGQLKPGDLAPDFNLKEQKSSRTVRLSDFRGVRPVALVFGSFT